MPDKTPTPDFSLPHTTLSQSQAWSLRVLFTVPRPPSLSGCAGSRCAALFPLTCHAPICPNGLPENSSTIDAKVFGALY